MIINMKKVLSALLTAILMLQLVSCSLFRDNETEPHESENQPQESESVTEPVTPMQSFVSVSYYDENLATGEYDEVTVDEGVHQVKVVFSCAGVVRDFCMLRVTSSTLNPSDKVNYSATELLYHTESLDADHPVLAGVVFIGTLSHIGITYTDELGNKKYFTLNTSGDTGDPILVVEEYIDDRIFSYLPDGATELLFCHRIFMSDTYLCMYRTDPAGICVFYTDDNGAVFHKIDLTLPGDVTYDTAEALFATTGGGSLEARIVVALTHGDEVSYISFNNFSYTDASDYLDFAYGGEYTGDIPG